MILRNSDYEESESTISTKSLEFAMLFCGFVTDIFGSFKKSNLIEISIFILTFNNMENVACALN